MKPKIILLSLVLSTLVLTAASASGEPAAKARGDRIDKLTIALAAFGTEAIDPILAIDDDKPWLRLIYSYLIDNDLRDKEPSKRTGLVKDWKWTENRTKLRVFLRQGVKFHNGDEVTTKDVEFCLNRLRSPEARYPYLKNILGPLDRMEIVNDYEMVFHLKKPAVTFLPAFGPILGGPISMIYPKAYFEQVGQEGFRRKPIGSGPYTLVRRETGSLLEFEAFDDYFLGPPRVKKMIFRLVPEETTRIAMLKRGEADVIEVSRENAESVRQAGFQLFSEEGGTNIYLLPHVWPEKDKTLSDNRVRKALFTSINKEEINKFLLKGQGKLSGNMIYEGSAVGGKPIPPHPYKPKEAEQLLREAGYPKDKLEVTVYVALKTGYPEAVDVAQAIAADWERIGVKSRIIPEQYGTLRPRLKAKELSTPSLRLHGLGCRPLHGNLQRNFWGCPGTLTAACDPEVAAMIDKVLKAPTLEEYGRRQQAVAQALYDRYYGTLIHVVGKVMATNDKVKEWRFGATLYSLNFRALALQGLLEE